MICKQGASGSTSNSSASPSPFFRISMTISISEGGAEGGGTGGGKGGGSSVGSKSQSLTCLGSSEARAARALPRVCGLRGKGSSEGVWVESCG